MTTDKRLIVAALFFAGFASCGSDDDGPAENTLLADRVLVIAHRGGNRLAPEHTILNYERALAQGVDVLEMDFRATSDGVLVLMHDRTVNRTTDGQGPVEDFSLDEIRELDAGYDYTQDSGATYPYRGMGLRVPTLEEIFERFAGVAMNIEIKAENPASVVGTFVDLLDRFNMRDKVLVASFSDDLIQQFRAAAPDVLTSYSPAEVIPFFVLSPENESTYEAPARFLQVPPFFEGVEVLTTAFVDRAHRLGLLVHAWGADDQMQEILALGVDGFIVDDTEQLIGLLGDS